MIEKQIFITNKCQQQCKYCQVEKGNWEMSLQELKNEIKMTAHDYPTDEIYFHLFGGEPLLVFNSLIKPLFENQKYPPRLKFYIATNGILLTKEIYSFLKQHNIQILLSIDGPEIYHDLNRNNFELIYSNLLNILEKDEKIYAIQATMAKNTILHLVEIFEFLKNLPANNIIIGLNKLDEYDQNDLEQLIKNLEFIYEQYFQVSVLGDIVYKYDSTKYFGLFQHFNEFNESNISFASQKEVVNHRVFLLSGLSENSNCQGFKNDFCVNCPLTNKCQPFGEKNTQKITNGMCMDLILKFYIPQYNTNKSSFFSQELPTYFLTDPIKAVDFNKINLMFDYYEAFNQELDKIEKISGMSLDLITSSKLVFEQNEKIYRIESAYMIKLRQAVLNMCKKNNINFFLNEEVVYLNNILGITCQEKVELITVPFDISERIMHDYPNEHELIVNFINTYSINFLELSHLGLDKNNKIKCFNYAIDAIVNDQGELQQC